MKSIINFLLLTTLTGVSYSNSYAIQEKLLPKLNFLNFKKYLYPKFDEDDLSLFNKARRMYRIHKEANKEEGNFFSNNSRKIGGGKHKDERHKERRKHQDVMGVWKKEDVGSNERTTPETKEPAKKIQNNILRRDANSNDDSAQRNHTREEDDISTSISSSRGIKEWKGEWLEHWTKKKIEVMNLTDPLGDEVNMLGARPWGVPCGDPHQIDAPWGTCLLLSECEPEFRIYRGDMFCGHKRLGCCVVLQSNYDFDEGLDFDFYDKSLSTETEEKREASKDIDRVKTARAMKHRRKRLRRKRQEKIVNKISKITDEIKKVLVKLQFNSTQQRRQKTKKLKRFIKSMKKDFKNQRLNLISLQNEIMIKIDVGLMKALNQILVVNKEFASNETFRNIVLNGAMTKTGERMLALTYPHLKPLLPSFRQNYRHIKARRRHSAIKRLNPMRRLMRFIEEPNMLTINDTMSDAKNAPKYFEYDVEYGLLYY